jgi:NAD(P)-dependent dehydrogenase (short-subunit alcohol dehydrogenase family)
MVASLTPLGRVGMQNDISARIASLLLDDNRRVNGQWIEVYGGVLL